MKLSVSAYRAHANAHKKILSSGYHTQLNYGSTGAAATASSSSATAAVAAAAGTSGVGVGLYSMEPGDDTQFARKMSTNSDTDVISPTGTSSSGQEQQHPQQQQQQQLHSATIISSSGGKKRSHHHHHQYHHHHHHRHQQHHSNNDNDDDNNSNAHSSDSKSPSQRKSRIGDGASDPDSDWTRSNQRWMKLRTTVQISSAMQKKPPLKREDSFLKRFSTRQIPETQETVEDTGSESASGDVEKTTKRRRRYLQKRRSVVNPDENFYFYWLMMLTICVLYNLWALIVRESFPELQKAVPTFWLICDIFTDVVFIFDIIVQLRTGYLEQGLMVYDDKKLACHYIHSRDFFFDIMALIPLDLLQLRMGTHPLLRFTRFFKVYRSVRFYYIVESRTVWPNLWRVVNLIHILLILAHWFGCFYYLLSEAEGFQGDWVYPYRPGDYATLTRKYLGSLYWSTLTLTTIGDLPTPETNAEYVFTIVSYLIGVFIFATIVGQVGNVITNRNANRLEFERLLDGAKTYMRHHKVPGGMKRRVLRWYDYSWSRGRIQGGGDINTALGLLPDKLKTELALHVNLSVLKKVTIFQECQPEFLHDLVLKMKAYIFTPGDSICRKGEVAREMFIIADGILEVLSETGKVLTTMKAGDFFGEIGILNLDGLNKRTADVRSVGYSELFSLSREDVLAAMKDYPEAQEILQTLGRKRLMEVRCVNKKYAKAQSDKEAAAAAAAAALAYQNAHHHGHVHQSDSSENSASKKIVDKLRNDVMGFRNVLKKSRTSRRSDESLEMQPLHNTSPKSAKTTLKRMTRVRSDEKEETTEEKDEQHDKTPSPIGAGLPLLQRLRLLKEKQDREERAVKSTTSQQLQHQHQKSPTHSHVTSTLSPQESIQEEPEREVNEGLPLIQRLQHLKFKNDALLNENKTAMINAPATISSRMDMIAASSSNSGGGNSLKPHLSKLGETTSSSGSGGAMAPSALAVAQIKPMMKVSFKQRIQQLQSAAVNVDERSSREEAAAAAEMASGRKEPPKTLAVIARNAIHPDADSSGTSSSGCMPVKPNTTVTVATISNRLAKPPLKTSTATSDTDTDTTPIGAWSRLKLATLISSSYTSLTNCSPESLETPLRNFSLGSIPHMVINEESAASGLRTNAIPGAGMGRKVKSCIQRASLHTRTLAAVRSQVSATSKTTKSGNGAAAQHLKPTAATASNRTKFYQSVFDLSPEYSGLPFVKRLKILNERQKLAELERAIQTRSFSLDSSKAHIGVVMPPISESLYRCYSDTSGIYSQLLSTYESGSCSTTTNNTSTTTPTPENLRRCSQHNDGSANLQQQLQKQQVPEYAPLSPESNETYERRQLKSILKNLHKATTDNEQQQLQQHDQQQHMARKHSSGLLREPTLEGPPECAKATNVFHYESEVQQQQQQQHVASSSSSGDERTQIIAAAELANCSAAMGTSSPAPLMRPAVPVNTPVDMQQPQAHENALNATKETVPPSPPLQPPATPPISSSTSSVPATSSAVAAAAAAAAAATKLECTKSAKLTNYNLTSTIHTASYVPPLQENIPPPPPIPIPPTAQSVPLPTLKPLQQLEHSSYLYQSQFQYSATATATTTDAVATSASATTKATATNLLTCQMPKMEGVQEVHDYFNDILCGINNVISAQINEMHTKLEMQFSNMACEVKRRDAVIAHLQMKLRSLETKTLTSTPSRRKPQRERLLTQQLSDDVEPKSEENSSSGSSAELLFMRGDSLDTVFTSSPPIHGERGNGGGMSIPQDGSSVSAYAKYCAHSNGGANGSRGSISGRAVMVSDVTGNLTRLADSVILDMGESSSSSSSSVKGRTPGARGRDVDDDGDDDVYIDEDVDDGDVNEVPDEEDDDDGVSKETEASGHMHHNDWEVRMLAAEMEKQERRRGHSLSVNLEDLKSCNTFLRRRRKFSETETEYSETDADDAGLAASLRGTVPSATRPRASSLDQFNLRYGIGSGTASRRGIFKAMSIDRDKDKL